MSVSTLCEICQNREADHSCTHCGQIVCDRHYEEQTNRCVECEAELGGTGGGHSQEKNLPDGVDTYEF